MKTNEYLIKRILDLENEVVRLKKEVNQLTNTLNINGIWSETTNNRKYPEVDEE